MWFSGFLDRYDFLNRNGFLDRCGTFCRYSFL
jgi:hypothetical protein